MRVLKVRKHSTINKKYIEMLRVCNRVMKMNLELPEIYLNMSIHYVRKFIVVILKSALIN